MAEERKRLLADEMMKKMGVEMEPTSPEEQEQMHEFTDKLFESTAVGHEATNLSIQPTVTVKHTAEDEWELWLGANQVDAGPRSKLQLRVWRLVANKAKEKAEQVTAELAGVLAALREAMRGASPKPAKKEYAN